MPWFLEALSIIILLLLLEWSLIWQQFYQTQKLNNTVKHPGLPDYGLWIRWLAVLGMSALLWKISSDLTSQLGRAWAIGTIAPFFARKDRSLL